MTDNIDFVEWLEKASEEGLADDLFAGHKIPEDDFIFTADNLMENIDKLGPWSAYGLAGEALQYYFPNEYDENGYCDTDREIELLHSLGCKYWQDAIKKYHREVGYSPGPNGFNPGAVNFS